MRGLGSPRKGSILVCGAGSKGGEWVADAQDDSRGRRAGMGRGRSNFRGVDAEVAENVSSGDNF